MANPSSHLLDVIIKLFNALECPVCYEYVRSPIYQCTSGHILCGKCKSTIYRCPTCRAEMSGVRVRSLETISDIMLFPCKNDGCEKILPLLDLQNHEEICRHANAFGGEVDPRYKNSSLQHSLLEHFEQHIAPFFVSKNNKDHTHQETQTEQIECTSGSDSAPDNGRSYLMVGVMQQISSDDKTDKPGFNPQFHCVFSSANDLMENSSDDSSTTDKLKELLKKNYHLLNISKSDKDLSTTDELVTKTEVPVMALPPSTSADRKVEVKMSHNSPHPIEIANILCDPPSVNEMSTTTKTYSQKIEHFPKEKCQSDCTAFKSLKDETASNGAISMSNHEKLLRYLEADSTAPKTKCSLSSTVSELPKTPSISSTPNDFMSSSCIPIKTHCSTSNNFFELPKTYSISPNTNLRLEKCETVKNNFSSISKPVSESNDVKLFQFMATPKNLVEENPNVKKVFKKHGKKMPVCQQTKNDFSFKVVPTVKNFQSPQNFSFVPPEKNFQLNSAAYTCTPTNSFSSMASTNVVSSSNIPNSSSIPFSHSSCNSSSSMEVEMTPDNLFQTSASKSMGSSLAHTPNVSISKNEPHQCSVSKYLTTSVCGIIPSSQPSIPMFGGIVPSNNSFIVSAPQISNANIKNSNQLMSSQFIPDKTMNFCSSSALKESETSTSSVDSRVTNLPLLESPLKNDSTSLPQLCGKSTIFGNQPIFCNGDLKTTAVGRPHFFSNPCSTSNASSSNPTIETNALISSPPKEVLNSFGISNPCNSNCPPAGLSTAAPTPASVNSLNDFTYNTTAPSTSGCSDSILFTIGTQNINATSTTCNKSLSDSMPIPAIRNSDSKPVTSTISTFPSEVSHSTFSVPSCINSTSTAPYKFSLYNPFRN